MTNMSRLSMKFDGTRNFNIFRENLGSPAIRLKPTPQTYAGSNLKRDLVISIIFIKLENCIPFLPNEIFDRYKDLTII